MTREEFDKAQEERKKAVHFRAIGVPCCGNCKYFTYRDYCENPDNMTKEPWGGVVWQRPLLFPSGHKICDCFAPKEEGTENA